MTGEKWPVTLRGVTESIVTTLGPNDRYNVAALGVHAPDSPSPETVDDGTADDETPSGVTARTWGRTRTWRNFRERGAGYVQFTRDPIVFVDAALDIREQDDPVLDSADAWARVSVTEIDRGTDEGTQWVDWRLTVEASVVENRVVPTFNRGFAAVIEATVAASRLDVAGYDTETLEKRIDYFETVVDRCGGPQEREAFERIRALLEE